MPQPITELVMEYALEASTPDLKNIQLQFEAQTRRIEEIYRRCGRENGDKMINDAMETLRVVGVR